MALPLLLGRHLLSQIVSFRSSVNSSIRSICRLQQISSCPSLAKPKSVLVTKCRYISVSSRNVFRQLVSVEHSPVRTLIVTRSVLLNRCHVNKLSQCLVRHMSKGRLPSDRRARSILVYISAVGIFMLGMSYAGVPLYRMFCQTTGLGGQATKGHDDGKVESMSAVKNRLIRIRFNADVASSMRWNFKPQQTEVKVHPGETALAFYTARNPTDKPIIGISTYNVVPFEAGQYFNKIQCFCFEEQRLNPNEEVDMPVFFFIDPEYAEDPKLETVDTITLSYTFFEAKEGLQLPLPGYATS